MSEISPSQFMDETEHLSDDLCETLLLSAGRSFTMSYTVAHLRDEDNPIKPIAKGK